MGKQRSVRIWVVLGIAGVVVAALAVTKLIEPPRGDVLVIGDSLTAFAQTTGLSNADWDIDARPGRKTSEAIDVAERRHASDYPVVIVAVGSNDDPGSRGAYAEQIDKMMDVVGPRPRVVWVNVDTGATGLNGAEVVNEALDDAAEVYANLAVGDWDGYRTSVPGFDDLRGADGVHYGLEGSGFRARWTLLVGLQELARAELVAGDR